MHTNTKGLCILESIHLAKLHHSAGSGGNQDLFNNEAQVSKLTHFFIQTSTFMSGGDSKIIIHGHLFNQQQHSRIPATEHKPIQLVLFLYNSDFCVSTATPVTYQ